MMRSARTRFSSILGALTVIGVVLAIAIHIGEQMRGNAASPSLAAVGIRGEGTPVVPMLPVLTVLDRIDAADKGRARILVHALLPQPADRARIEAELDRLAEALYRDHPKVSAIAVLGYLSATQRAALGENAPWTLVWCRDGLGWNGDRQDDFEKHIQGPPEH